MVMTGLAGHMYIDCCIFALYVCGDNTGTHWTALDIGWKCLGAGIQYLILTMIEPGLVD